MHSNDRVGVGGGFVLPSQETRPHKIFLCSNISVFYQPIRHERDMQEEWLVTLLLATNESIC